MKNNKIIQANSYQEYLDLCKEKWNKIEIGEDVIYGVNEIYFIISSVKDAEEVLQQSIDDNLNFILKEFINHYMEFCTGVGIDNNNTQLEELLLTHEDYYWGLYDGERHWYNTCCAKLEFTNKFDFKTK